MRNGSRDISENYILAEHRVNIYINDVLTARLMYMAEYLLELGRMLTERFIRDDV